MKILLTIILVLFGLHAGCQAVIKYYDDIGREVAADKAVYYAKFVKEGSVYECTTYWKDNNALKGKATYPDTALSSPDGTLVMYDRKGHLEDSIFYSEGKTDFSYHYYPNGQLAVHYHLPYNKKEGVTEAFDENGKKITNFIMSKDAEFKGGEDAWQAYLKKNTSKDLTLKGSKGGVTLTVEVEFTIDEEGMVASQKISRSSGYKNVDKDALRVISESPKWNPGISYNKAVKAYKVQPITYEIPENK
ncbi:MAG: TonB family protein [Ginsengibacter sp.]